MIAVNIDIPASDINAMRNTFARYVQWFRKGPQEAVKKTCVYIVKSLRADTKIGAKARRVVPNPNYININRRGGANKRLRQLGHIKAWYETRGKAPPKDTAEYFMRFAIERYTQRKGTRYIPIPAFGKITEAKQYAKLSMQDQYLIKRRGLAKSSWGWMLGKLGKADGVDQPQISGATEVTSGTTGGAFDSYFVDLINRLSYIRRATRVNVNSVLGRASRNMQGEMERHAKRARQQAGLRAA